MRRPAPSSWRPRRVPSRQRRAGSSRAARIDFRSFGGDFSYDGKRSEIAFRYKKTQKGNRAVISSLTIGTARRTPSPHTGVHHVGTHLLRRCHQKFGLKHHPLSGAEGAFAVHPYVRATTKRAGPRWLCATERHISTRARMSP